MIEIDTTTNLRRKNLKKNSLFINQPTDFANMPFDFVKTRFSAFLFKMDLKNYCIFVFDEQKIYTYRPCVAALLLE